MQKLIIIFQDIYLQNIILLTFWVLIKELIIRHMEQLYKEDDYYFRREQMGNSLYNVLINNYINNSNIVRKD